MALVTLSDYKTAIGETDASRDAYHQLALDAASDAILAYSDRDFGSPLVTETRAYKYGGAGVLEIDDAQAINTVTFAGAAALVAGSWIAKKEGPTATAPFSYLLLPVIDWGRSAAQSLGEMGFTRNLDRFLASPGGFRELDVSVNAQFGWPTVPKDVQRAVIWTAQDFEAAHPSGGGSGDLASKSVAEVAESYFAEQVVQAGSSGPGPIPQNAAAVIDNYRRLVL